MLSEEIKINGNCYDIVAWTAVNLKEKSLCALLDSGANPNSVIVSDAKGECSTPILYEMVKMKKSNMVKILLKYGANPNGLEITSKNQRETQKPILYCAAVQIKDYEIVKLLIDNGADVNAVRTETNKGKESKYSVLSETVWYTMDYKIAALLVENNCDCNYVNHVFNQDGSEDFLPALFYTIRERANLRIVNLLFQHGCNGNEYRIKKEINGQKKKWFLLKETVWKAKNFELMKLFLDNGANPNILDEDANYSSNSLYEAIVLNRIDMVKALLEFGGNPNEYFIAYKNNKIEQKVPMLFLAVMHSDNIELVELLIQYGAKWDVEVVVNGIVNRLKKYPLDVHFKKDNIYYSQLKCMGWKGAGWFG